MRARLASARPASSSDTGASAPARPAPPEAPAESAHPPPPPDALPEAPAVARPPAVPPFPPPTVPAPAPPPTTAPPAPGRGGLADADTDALDDPLKNDPTERIKALPKSVLPRINDGPTAEMDRDELERRRREGGGPSQ